MSSSGMLVEFGQALARHRSIILDQSDHARQGAAVSIQETFNDSAQDSLHLNIQAVSIDIGAHKCDDLIGRSAWAKAAFDAHGFDGRDVLIGQDTASRDQHIINIVLLEQFYDTWEQRHMST